VWLLCILSTPQIMSSITVASVSNFQLQSPLVCLPAEIKHIIFRQCFTADEAIADPTICSKTESSPISSLGVALLQTCRRLYFEADRHHLFSQNTFRFTTVDSTRTFLKSLDEDHRQSIQDIEIDVRKVHSNDSDFDLEWVRYLDWNSTSGTLNTDVSNLKTLRLNFESWPRIPMFRTELWSLLREMLSDVRGLERIVVVGASKGQAMARRDPWSPAHYVGAEDVELNDLIPRMSRCVEGSDDAKVIRWVRNDGKLYLEVVSKAHLAKHINGNWIGSSASPPATEPWPMNGSCSLVDYANRRSNVQDPMAKSFSPNVVG
jgi:hypothetical protein